MTEENIGPTLDAMIRLGFHKDQAQQLINAYGETAVRETTNRAINDDNIRSKTAWITAVLRDEAEKTAATSAFQSNASKSKSSSPHKPFVKAKPCGGCIDGLIRYPLRLPGRNFAYQPVTVKSSANLLGKTLHVKIVKAFSTYLKGKTE